MSAAATASPSHQSPAHDPDTLRRVQRLAYDAAVETAAALVPGGTERAAARRRRRALEARGVRRWFHAPFAWFGARSAFEGFGGMTRKFMPTDLRLEPGMVAILDVAPVVDGHTADI